MSSAKRLEYIDWMRGLACLLMFQWHCYSSWLSDAPRHTTFFKWAQLGGTLPAPLFLFLAGVSFALVTDKLRQRGTAANAIAAVTIRRGAEIFALGLLFRVQEFVLGLPNSPWTDLLRVDILNTIGISMILMGVICRFAPMFSVAKQSRANFWLASITAAAIALFTPPLWSTWAPRGLPWFLESYINGVHTFGQPQPWLFPIFPWTAFAFAGLASGFVLFSDWANSNWTNDKLHNRLALTTLLLGLTGAIFYKLGLWIDALSLHIYAVYDFWHSSPEFLLVRVGLLLMIILIGYAWCRWGAPARWFSPLAQLGQTSLLVYWVHIEFVYGRFSILRKNSQSLPMSTLGFATIFSAMLLLSMLRTRWKEGTLPLPSWLRGPLKQEVKQDRAAPGAKCAQGTAGDGVGAG
jgi:uncharacterized membrane protein